MDAGLLSSLVPFVLWIGGFFCWWGLRGRLWYRSTRHLWPCFFALNAGGLGGLTVPKLPPHDKQWCCFRASSGSRKYKAVRVAPCFPENPCAVCGKACGLTERELDRTRHPCGAGCGCRCALCGCCRYTNAGECERMLCEDTVPEDVVGNTVASVAAGGLSAIATALTSVGRSVEQLTRQQMERQQRRQREAPAPAEMHRGYAPHPPPSNYPGAPAGTQWEIQRQVYEQSPYPQPNYAPPPPAPPRPRLETGDPFAPLAAAEPASPSAPPTALLYPSVPAGIEPSGPTPAAGPTPAGPTREEQAKVAAAKAATEAKAAATKAAKAAKATGSKMATMLGKGMQAVGKRMEDAGKDGASKSKDRDPQNRQ